MNSIADRISSLKSALNATVLAHHYQDDEIKDVADAVGDTLALTRTAETFRGKMIVLCGVRFMAELAKMLNPNTTVLLPDLGAGCSLVDSCPAAAVRAFRKSHPDYAIVSYINTSAEVKAESDILCTSGNAVAVVNSIPPNRPILFLPDVNLGNWVKRQTNRKNMQIWQGACIIHATFPARQLTTQRFQHPHALVAAHPGSPAEILRLSDFVGSTSAIIEWCRVQTAAEFIICAESGLHYSLHKHAPGKRFYFVTSESCNCSECPYQRMNTLEKLLSCLQSQSPCIEMSDDLLMRARLPYERMLKVL